MHTQVNLVRFRCIGLQLYPCMPLLKTYLVEDSLVIRQSLISALEELAQITIVGTAEDEKTATLWLADPQREVDLVIIDIFLKQGSGMGVLADARALHPKTKMIVLTNYATVDIRAKSLALGANRVFDKSNEIEALLEYCEKLVNGESDTAPGALPYPPPA